MTNENKTQSPLFPMYGVWIPGKGWVRAGKDNATFADRNKQIAEELARRLKNGATVYYIDNALVDLESQLLEAEKQKNIYWHYFRFIVQNK